MVMDALLNRDVLAGRWRQCAALVRHSWARLRGDPLLGTRSYREYAHGAVQVRYGRTRAAIELRVRELERGI
jgi:hypothetical protein